MRRRPSTSARSAATLTRRLLMLETESSRRRRLRLRSHPRRRRMTSPRRSGFPATFSSKRPCVQRPSSLLRRPLRRMSPKSSSLPSCPSLAGCGRRFRMRSARSGTRRQPSRRLRIARSRSEREIGTV